MAARTSWKQRIGEILALGAFAFVWVRIVNWLTWPLWGWQQAAVAVGGIAAAGIAYESGKRCGRRSPEQPETLMIWLFAYLCGLRLGRLEASAGSRRSDSKHSHIV